MTARAPSGDKWTVHRTHNACENVDDLIAAGESREHALARAGISADTYDKHRERHPARGARAVA